MNWKRGLTRVYVVFWALLVVGGVVMAVSATGDVVRERRKVADFLKSHGMFSKSLCIHGGKLTKLTYRAAVQYISWFRATEGFHRSSDGDRLA